MPQPKKILGKVKVADKLAKNAPKRLGRTSTSMTAPNRMKSSMRQSTVKRTRAY